MGIHIFSSLFILCSHVFILLFCSGCLSMHIIRLLRNESWLWSSKVNILRHLYYIISVTCTFCTNSLQRIWMWTNVREKQIIAGAYINIKECAATLVVRRFSVTLYKNMSKEWEKDGFKWECTVIVFNATFNKSSDTYRAGQSHQWRKSEYLEKTTDLRQVIDKLYNIILYPVYLIMNGIRTHNVSVWW